MNTLSHMTLTELKGKPLIKNYIDGRCFEKMHCIKNRIKYFHTQDRTVIQIYQPINFIYTVLAAV